MEEILWSGKKIYYKRVKIFRKILVMEFEYFDNFKFLKWFIDIYCNFFKY